MKMLLNTLLFAGLIGLITATLSLATGMENNPERRPKTGWVTSTDVAFKVRATQLPDNQLSIHVQNPGFERLWLNLRTLDGEDIFHLPLPESQVMHQLQLDISHFHPGAFRIEVVSGTNKVATIVPLQPIDLTLTISESNQSMPGEAR